MNFTAAQIASFIDGEIIGDEQVTIVGVAPIEKVEPGFLSFVAQEKYASYIDSVQGAVLIVSRKFLQKKSYPSTLIAVEDAYLSFQVLLNLYQNMKQSRRGVEQPSFVHDTVALPQDIYIGAFAYIDAEVKIGEGTEIYPHAFIGKNVKIGKNCCIHSGAKIYEYTVIGDNCTIHANSVIGSDGFGFQPGPQGYAKIPQLGNVVLEDDVEIGANCTIDRGTIGSTIIGQGTKVDNLIQIAHNVTLGKHNVIAAQAGIAGSATIGDWNMIGGQTGIVGHIKIGNQVRIQAQSGVNSNVKDGQTLYGSPAMEAGDFRRNYVHFRNFDKIVKKLDALSNNKAENE